MTAVTDILNQSLKDVGVVGDGQTASSEQIDSAFVTFQQMLAMWQSDSMYVYAQVETSFNATSALSYTVGSGGNFNIVRPAKIDYAFFRINDLDYRIDLLHSFEEYEAIAQKTLLGAYPCVGYYNPSYPLGTLYVYPQIASGAIKIVTRIQFPVYATVADDLDIPPEDALAVRYSLAELLSAENQTPLRPDVAALAKRARTIMKRKNLKIPAMELPPALVRGHSDILSG